MKIAERQAAARRELLKDPFRANAEIASSAGVSYYIVQQVRLELEQNGLIVQYRHRGRPEPKSVLQRALEKILPVNASTPTWNGSPCWIFAGSLNEYGYGLIYSGPGSHRGRHSYVHRVVYDRFNGSVPEGMTLDHLCRNRNCCQPKHLEPVSRVENIMRGESPWAINARKTHCPQGHEYTEENTIIIRKCRTCTRNHLDDKRRGRTE